ncbi:MAG: hypothetical protein NXI01_06635 [Gammaproteobacteria bacterium]|nr:hypothetical protein [Gammaproteobacteria bacterium]
MKKIMFLLGLLCSSVVFAKPCCPIRLINNGTTDLTVHGTLFNGGTVEQFTLPAGQFYYQLATVENCKWTEGCAETGAFLYINDSNGDPVFVGEVPYPGAVIIKGTGMVKNWTDNNRFTPYIGH